MPVEPTAPGARTGKDVIVMTEVTPTVAADRPSPPPPATGAFPAAGRAGPNRRGRPRRRRPVAVAAAAAAVVLLIGAAAIVAGTRPDRPPAAEPGGAPWRQWLVRDGGTVAGSGLVLSLPGQGVRFCAPDALVQPSADDQPPGPPRYCEAGVTLHGADLTALAGRTERAGAVWGDAWIEGTYRTGGELTVTRQGTPRPAPEEDRGDRMQPPCPAPDGGWQRGTFGDDRLRRRIDAEPDRFGGLAYRPYGIASPGPGYLPTQVAVVGTVGDPAAVERALRPLYAGNLCVIRIPHSRAEVAAAMRRVQTDYLSNRVYESAADYGSGFVRLRVVLIDNFLAGVLDGWDAGTGVVDARPWLRPVR